MSLLQRIPEDLRGWFYFILALVLLAMLVMMFVVAIQSGEDFSDWMPVVLSALGLSGASLASANTERRSLRKRDPETNIP